MANEHFPYVPYGTSFFAVLTIEMECEGRHYDRDGGEEVEEAGLVVHLRQQSWALCLPFDERSYCQRQADSNEHHC